MKRIWNAIGKTAKDGSFQKKAIKHVEQMESGAVAAAKAPKVPTEERRFQEALQDDSIKEELAKKHEGLVDNMNKFQIKSTDPPEPEKKSSKSFPTRESEYLHRNDPIWEYGFYEPPVEKIPKNKLMFREALEILHARLELENTDVSHRGDKRREIAETVLGDHAAKKRVDDGTIDKLFEYFRPFERRDTQKVVNKHELAQLQDILQGRADMNRFTDGAKEHVQQLLKDKAVREEYDRLDDQEKQKFAEAVAEIRQLENERLDKRLENIKMMESAVEKATAEIRQKEKK